MDGFKLSTKLSKLFILNKSAENIYSVRSPNHSTPERVYHCPFYLF